MVNTMKNESSKIPKTTRIGNEGLKIPRGKKRSGFILPADLKIGPSMISTDHEWRYKIHSNTLFCSRCGIETTTKKFAETPRCTPHMEFISAGFLE
jgi:hypothetical protein